MAWFPKALLFLAPALIAGITALVASVQGLNINPMWVAVIVWVLQQATALLKAYLQESKYK